ncbi:MAG: LytTR family DNA-binding domain-containing protein [Vicingaceae bacterium]
MKLKTVIIDDEIKAVGVLRRKLEAWIEDVEIVGTANSVTEGLELLEKEKVDLVFLDIEMRDGSGFTLLRQLPQIDFEVVFTTAFNEYAVQAFKVNALDYILKPIDSAELEVSLKRAMKKRLESNGLEMDRIKELLRSQKVNKLAIKERGKVTFVDVNSLIYLLADGVYTEIYTSDKKKFVTSSNLGHYEKVLDGDGFLRVHRSHLINVDCIKEYLTGDHLVIMNDGKMFPVAKSSRHELNRVLNR